METIVRFQKVEDAYLFRAYLESEGIAAHVLDENISQMSLHHAIAVGGVRVAVADEDAEQAAAFHRNYTHVISTEAAAVGAMRFFPFALLVRFLVWIRTTIFGRKPPLSEDRNP